MTDYTEAFAAFILECKAGYEDIVRSIENGDVSAGHAAKLTIELSPDMVDQIRFERLAAIASDDGC
jgi:hypothetical protein